MPQPVQYRGMTLIVPDNDSEWTEFYAHARAHRLVVRACTGCGLMRYPPTHACPWCMALGWTWQELSGRGTIYSYEIVHHAIQPGFRGLTPYPVVLVELDAQRGRPTRAAAVACGWTSHHCLCEPSTYLQPIPTLARVAAEAPGLTLGTGCLRLPLHHPVEIAEQLATLDVITGGRFVFGVGLGYRDVETRAMGHDPKERVGRLVEGLEVIERLWNGEPVTYHGTHFRLPEVRISMRPLQRPRPPVWLAANSDGGVRRAARLGGAWMMDPRATLPTLERQQALFRRTRGELGRPAATETPLIKECSVAPDSSAAFAESAAFLDAKYRAYRRWEQDKALPAGETFAGSFEELARDRFV